MCAKRNFTPLNLLLSLMPKPAALRDCLMPEPAFSIFRLGRAAGAIAAAWLAAGLAGSTSYPAEYIPPANYYGYLHALVHYLLNFGSVFF